MSEQESVHIPEDPQRAIVRELQKRTKRIEGDNVGNPYYDEKKSVRGKEVDALLTAMETGELNRKEVIDILSTQESESHLDPLMGIYTRKAGEHRLDEELAIADREGSPLTVAMIDLDHFKEVNDTLGHDGGDAVLQQAAGHIQQSIRTGDVAFRFGGEEIMVMFRADEKTAGEVIDRVRKTMPDTVGEAVASMGFDLGDREITMSAGIAQGTRDKHVTTLGRLGEIRGVNTAMKDHMLKSADVNVYKAKHGGRNCVYDSQGNVTERLSAKSEELTA